MTRSHVRYKSCRISWTKCQMSWTPLQSWQSKHPSTLLTTGRLCSESFSSLELLSKSAWRYRKVTVGAGLKCWQAQEKGFSLKVQCIRPLSNVSKTWLNRSPPQRQDATLTSVGPCNLSATATSRQKTEKLGLFSPRTMPVELRLGDGWTSCSRTAGGWGRWGALVRRSQRTLDLHGHCHTVGKQRMCVTPCSLPGGAG